MPVYDKHKDYTSNVQKWLKVRDCLAGSDVIKRKGSRYLPIPDNTGTMKEDDTRYLQYKERATFTNATRRTLEALVGFVFRKAPTKEVPATIAHLLEDVNGDDLSLVHLAKQCVVNTLATGRHGLLVDYPTAEAGLTKAQVQSLSLHSYITSYQDTTIINWRTERVGGVTRLSLIVLEEAYEKVNDDGFGCTEGTQYRVLKLNPEDDWKYEQRLYRDTDGYQTYDLYQPKGADGNRLDFIPFVFIGSANNDSRVDYSPLYDLAEINIAHYRNSADFEEMAFIVGQPTLFVSTNMSADKFKQFNGDAPLTLGCRNAYNLGENGSAEMLQINPSQISQIAAQDKLEQMIMLGARLITQTGSPQTATESISQDASETSVLNTITGNVSDAITRALEYACVFDGGSPEEIEFKLNSDFIDEKADPQMIMAQIQLLDRGIIAKSDLRTNLRQANIIEPEREDEHIDEDIDNSGGF